jgi:hypothetical protein
MAADQDFAVEWLSEWQQNLMQRTYLAVSGARVHNTFDR